MDITLPLYVVLGLSLGFIAGVWFVPERLDRRWIFLLSLAGLSLLLALPLMPWDHLTEAPVDVARFVGLLAGIHFAASVVGAAPPVVVARLWRLFRNRQARAGATKR